LKGVRDAITQLCILPSASPRTYTSRISSRKVSALKLTMTLIPTYKSPHRTD
jgi:hypothetical protein